MFLHEISHCPCKMSIIYIYLHIIHIVLIYLLMKSPIFLGKSSCFFHLFPWKNSIASRLLSPCAKIMRCRVRTPALGPRSGTVPPGRRNVERSRDGQGLNEEKHGTLLSIYLSIYLSMFIFYSMSYIYIIYIYMHIYIHTYIYIYIYIHTIYTIIYIYTTSVFNKFIWLYIYIYTHIVVKLMKDRTVMKVSYYSSILSRIALLDLVGFDISLGCH